MIQLTDISSEATAFYTNHLGPDARVIFEQVDFSYNQLTSFGNTFMEVVDSPIVGFGLRTMENTFNVTLDYQSPRSVEVYEAINEFRRLVPIPIDVRLGELDVILPLTIY
ncbi:MAG: hypothetical protein FWE20_09415 [Defluviitaleaceae bacterium]|nr:hypothetical protein [Defluviitaleaceae bacterium]